MNSPDREDSLTLEILEAIEARSDVTQRTLARRMNVALGLANSYLKRCVRKGWIKIHQAPANRYLYYLTPTGFAEKSRLTGRYLSLSLGFYRKAGESCRDAIRECRARRWHRVVLCGVSELAEIASLRALEHDVKVVGVYDARSGVRRFLNRTVSERLERCGPFDGCLVTDLSDPGRMYADVVRVVEPPRVIVPGILGFRPGAARQGPNMDVESGAVSEQPRA